MDNVTDVAHRGINVGLTISIYFDILFFVINVLILFHRGSCWPIVKSAVTWCFIDGGPQSDCNIHSALGAGVMALCESEEQGAYLY